MQEAGPVTVEFHRMMRTKASTSLQTGRGMPFLRVCACMSAGSPFQKKRSEESDGRILTLKAFQAPLPILPIRSNDFSSLMWVDINTESQDKYPDKFRE